MLLLSIHPFAADSLFRKYSFARNINQNQPIKKKTTQTLKQVTFKYQSMQHTAIPGLTNINIRSLFHVRQQSYCLHFK